jgi:hypothetical protein
MRVGFNLFCYKKQHAASIFRAAKDATRLLLTKLLPTRKDFDGFAGVLKISPASLLIFKAHPKQELWRPIARNLLHAPTPVDENLNP